MSDSHGHGAESKGRSAVPGEHNTGVLKGTPLGKLVWFLAHKFLTKHGTQLNGGIHLTHVEVCECYAGIRMYMSDFRNMHGPTGAQLGRTDRNVSNHFAQHHFWVNEHHLGQFMKAFPLMAPIDHESQLACKWRVPVAAGAPENQVDRSLDLHSACKVRVDSAAGITGRSGRLSSTDLSSLKKTRVTAQISMPCGP